MNQTKDVQLEYLSVKELYPHPDNPRKDLGDLSELAESIKVKGVMQNLTVVKGHRMTDEEWYVAVEDYKKDPTEEKQRIVNKKYSDDGYTVIIGHRRCAAAKLAGLEKLPCMISDMSYKDQIATMILENVQRSDLTVYEQAQSFQLMIQLGDTPEGISEKTGFSNSTVRRRLKMAELDQDKLKEACSDRQISIGDVDKLSQVQDMEVRNGLLDKIGTKDFDFAVKSAVIKEKREANLPYLMEQLKYWKALKLDRHAIYSGKYESRGSYKLEDFTEGSVIRVSSIVGRLYYYIDDYNGECKLYTEKLKAPPVKRPKKEIEREKYIAETREKLDELHRIAFGCRLDFIKKIKLTKENMAAMLHGAALVMILNRSVYSSSSTMILKELFGAEFCQLYGDDRCKKMRELLDQNGPAMIPGIIYWGSMDDANLHCYSDYKGEFPKYRPNLTLQFLYEWLLSIGYEMSEDERMLIDGTHPLFVDKDRKEE